MRIWTQICLLPSLSCILSLWSQTSCGKYLGLFPNKCSPTPDGHLSSYLPMTTTTYFSDAWTTWSSLSPSPKDWLSSGSTESNVSSPGFPGKNKSYSQKQLYLTIPFSSLFPPSETSNSLSMHLLPRPIPVTGRPCGLFNVTSGPETYITWTSLTAKAAVYKVLSQFTLSCDPTTTLRHVINHTLNWISFWPLHMLSSLPPQGLCTCNFLCPRFSSLAPSYILAQMLPPKRPKFTI